MYPAGEKAVFAAAGMGWSCYGTCLCITEAIVEEGIWDQQGENTRCTVLLDPMDSLVDGLFPAASADHFLLRGEA